MINLQVVEYLRKKLQKIGLAAAVEARKDFGGKSVVTQGRIELVQRVGGQASEIISQYFDADEFQFSTILK